VHGASKRSLHLKIQRLTRKIVLATGYNAGLKNYSRTQSHMKKASILFLGLVLSVLTFASGNNRFNEVFGPLFHPAPNVRRLSVQDMGSTRSTVGT
jgi:hypothetical protein